MNYSPDMDERRKNDEWGMDIIDHPFVFKENNIFLKMLGPHAETTFS